MGSIVLSNMLTGNVQRAVLEALAYSDIFDYPLRFDELHRCLPAQVGIEQLSQVLDSMNVQVQEKEGFYFLTGRDEIVETRKQRKKHSERLLPHALRYGRMLGSLPFVRMVAITGSLVVMNASNKADFDYLLVMVPGGLWTGRAFAVIVGRIMRLFGYRICVNLLLSEKALTWQQHDLYSAREICQMTPITGMDLYNRFRAANTWTESFLPNAELSAPDLIKIPARKGSNHLQRLMEWILRHAFGVPLERWVMKFQLQRMARHYGTSAETNFSSDICQANFHEHRQWTQKAFQSRVDALENERTIALADTTAFKMDRTTFIG
ncbi:MAG TPA: hypothetical protein VFR47_03525 [Anaerolineales bacterium]|nr:hypothetical protein [Anaerolineales bacterium]